MALKIEANSVNKIDASETAKVVTNFLHDDFQNLLNTAGLHRITDLSSPILSATPPDHSKENNQEKNVVDGLHEADAAKNACYAVFATINDLTQTARKPFKKVVQDVFIKGYTIERTSYDINKSTRSINNYKREALVEFANRFNIWKIQYHRTDLPDLRRWCSE